MDARLVIAGAHSGVGKTTITAGLIAALRARGLVVQPYKVGPDYIDPTYHTLAAGRPCRTLDSWMIPGERVAALFDRAGRGADVGLVEGVMGLFDGLGYDDEAGSTAQVAKLVGAPVVLVLDASKMGRTAGAIAAGFRRFDEGLNLAGFLVNRAGSREHGRGVAGAIERATGLPVLGTLTRDPALSVPERYLGLVPTVEPGRWESFLRDAGAAVADRVDLDRLLEIGRSAPARMAPADEEAPPASPARVVVAVARDEAFHFTYEENLELLRDAGAEVVAFSPLRDAGLPPGTAGVVLSGGFPEVFADRLAANTGLHEALRAAHARGLPIYAECGGLMALTEAIVDGDGREHRMAGLLPGRSVLGDRRALGYRVARAAGDSWLFAAGETVRGHEFHYSHWTERPDGLPPAYWLTPASGTGSTRPDGAAVGSLWASYLHLHFASKPELARRFVAACGGG